MNVKQVVIVQLCAMRKFRQTNAAETHKDEAYK